jgi:hypothetical protein
MVEFFFKIKNLIFSYIFCEKFKVGETKFREIQRNYTEFRGIFANSEQHTECTEVKKGTEFRFDGMP